MRGVASAPRLRPGSRRGPLPTCAGDRPVQTPAPASGETGGSRESVRSDPSHPVQSTAFSNPYVERLIGSIRRECLDYVIVLGENHLRRILRSYFTYYNG